MRVGMRANRFFPVINGSAAESIRIARSVGRRIVAV